MELSELLSFWSCLICMILGLVLSFLLALLIYKQNVWNQFNKMVFYVSLTDCVVFPAHIILAIGVYIYNIKPDGRFFLATYLTIMIPGYMAISLSFQQSISNTYLLFYSNIMDANKMKWCYIILTIIPACVLLSLCIEIVVNVNLKLLEKIQLCELVLQWILIIANVILYIVCVVSIQKVIGDSSVQVAPTSSSTAILSLVSRLKW